MAGLIRPGRCPFSRSTFTWLVVLDVLLTMLKNTPQSDSHFLLRKPDDSICSTWGICFADDLLRTGDIISTYAPVSNLSMASYKLHAFHLKPGWSILSSRCAIIIAGLMSGSSHPGPWNSANNSIRSFFFSPRHHGTIHSTKNNRASPLEGICFNQQAQGGKTISATRTPFNTARVRVSTES